MNKENPPHSVVTFVCQIAVACWPVMNHGVANLLKEQKACKSSCPAVSDCRGCF